MIGNGTSNTTINGTWNRIITISSDEVTVKNLKLISGSNTTSLVYIGAEYATLERLEIHGGYQAIEVKSRYAKILDSHVAGQSYSGIQVKAQGLNLEIANSIIRNSENSGIYVELGANYVDINNNSIHNNSGSGIWIPVIGDLRESPPSFFALQTIELNSSKDSVLALSSSNNSVPGNEGSLGNILTSTELES